MPPPIESESDIPIANFGSSGLGEFRTLYRKGLSLRYGRLMQAISGVHFNYSIPRLIWQKKEINPTGISESEISSKLYFRLLRNMIRNNWCVLYFFGASPVVTGNFIPKGSVSFKKLTDDTYYMPFATSLRMSRYGYRNVSREMINVSSRSLEEYIRDITEATNTPSEKESKSRGIKGYNTSQINNNILQIDDEYYAIARPKSMGTNYMRTTKNLEKGGVDFIELRSIDLNPYSRIGIEKNAIKFLELLAIHCLLKPDSEISDFELEEINHNEKIILEKGREKGLMLKRDGRSISLRSIGKELIEDLRILLDNFQDDDGYIEALNIADDQLKHPDSTISARMIDEILTNKISFSDYGTNLADTNKSYYEQITPENNKYWSNFVENAKNSIEKQKQRERTCNEDIDDVLMRYFRSD